MKKKKKSKFIEIPLRIYRTHVVVTWEQEVHKIANWGERNGIKSINEEWIGTFLKNKEKAVGVCLEFGQGNTDTLVWLKERPTKASTYGVLYHELYHAVDHISDTHNLANEMEARAFIYEFLVTECNKVLWAK